MQTPHCTQSYRRRQHGSTVAHRTAQHSPALQDSAGLQAARFPTSMFLSFLAATVRPSRHAPAMHPPPMKPATRGAGGRQAAQISSRVMASMGPGTCPCSCACSGECNATYQAIVMQAWMSKDENATCQLAHARCPACRQVQACADAGTADSGSSGWTLGVCGQCRCR
jgi:hypothetical protein